MSGPKPTAGPCEACGQWVERARKTGLDDSLVQVLASRLQEIDPEHHALIASLRAEVERVTDELESALGLLNDYGENVTFRDPGPTVSQSRWWNRVEEFVEAHEAALARNWEGT